MTHDTIRGYKPLGDRPKQRELSMEYIKQTPKAAKLLKILWETPEKNCTGREDEFSGDTLPTDVEAQMMCAGCPMATICEAYRVEAHPSWGVFSGRVQGRALEAAMKEDEDGK